jgi:peptidoglycan/xylan/chitin deacetylase (PgdA/CDA1 family)
VSGISDVARTLLALILVPLARLSSKRAGVALVYHRVGGEGGSEDTEILAAVSDAAFERQLRHLRGSYRIVAAEDLLAAVAGRGRGQRFPVAITFDDDLATHVRHALPALRRTGLTATFFLGGGSLDGPRPFWWEDLQRAVDDRLVGAQGLPHVPADAVQSALAREPRAILNLAGTITRLTPTQRHEVAATLREVVGQAHSDDGLRREDVKALSEAGCAIGFHTLAHEPLPALSDDELAHALHDGRDELANVAGTPVVAIAYPHGKADQRVAGAARAAGFTCGFTSARGPVTPATDPFLVPRTVADLSASALALRLARMFLRVH